MWVHLGRGQGLLRGFGVGPVGTAVRFPLGLSNVITVNGTSVGASFRDVAVDIVGTNWPRRVGTQSGTEVSTGDSPTTGTDATFLPRDTYVEFAAASGKIYQDSVTGGADLGTGDCVWEYVIKTPSSLPAQTYIAGSLEANDGWGLQQAPSSALLFKIGDGSSVTVTQSGVSGLNANLHILICINRDEASTDGFRIYINGVFSAGVDGSAVSGALDTTGKYTAGGRPNLGNKMNGGRIYHVAAWESAGLFSSGATGAAEMATLASERYAALG